MLARLRRINSQKTSRTTLLAAALLLSAAAFAAVPSTEFQVSGAVNLPTTYDLATLSALPATTQTVSYSSGSGTQTHTYTGTSVWGLLDSAGIVVNPNIKNDVLNKYVLATGSDGYRTVFSLGELNPNFGNQPDLAAYAETINGVSSPLGADGFARITAPGDVKGCPRRCKSDPPCRSNIDPGMEADRVTVSCGQV